MKYDGIQLSWAAKLAAALQYLGTKWVLHPEYDGKHCYLKFKRKD